MPTLAVYNRQHAEDMVRTWTPQRLFNETRAGRFGTELSHAESEELMALTRAWMQRALGPLSLRDALLVDPRRGARVYDLICTTLTVERHHVPIELAQALALPTDAEPTPQQIRAVMATLRSQRHAHSPEARDSEADQAFDTVCDALDTALQRAEAEQLALTWYDGDTARYPFPTTLEALLPPLPTPFADPVVQFEQPTGWRRTIAMSLAIAGLGLLVLPLLMGHQPQQPAGLPLALLTLALMVGTRAGWSGYAGALCIWLVANLPGFRHGTPFLWPAVPLLTLGLILLALDRHVRAMWRWICQLFTRRFATRR